MEFLLNKRVSWFAHWSKEKGMSKTINDLFVGT